MYAISDYRNAPSGIGPLANEWKDKPHRLLYDLCHRLEVAEGDGFGCHCDLGPGEEPDNCWLLDGMPNNCIFAPALVEEGKGPSDCPHWKPKQQR